MSLNKINIFIKKNKIIKILQKKRYFLKKPRAELWLVENYSVTLKMENLNRRKVRLAPFTQRENELLLNNRYIKDYYQQNKTKKKLEVAALIETDLLKLKILRDATAISKRLDNLKTSYRLIKKQEEAMFHIKWQYYKKMKEIFE